MKYYVTYKVEARYTVEVEAGSIEEASEKADCEFFDADFGVAEDINGEEMFIEDESGNCVCKR